MGIENATRIYVGPTLKALIVTEEKKRFSQHIIIISILSYKIQ